MVSLQATEGWEDLRGPCRWFTAIIIILLDGGVRMEGLWMEGPKWFSAHSGLSCLSPNHGVAPPMA